MKSAYFKLAALYFLVYSFSVEGLAAGPAPTSPGSTAPALSTAPAPTIPKPPVSAPAAASTAAASTPAAAPVSAAPSTPPGPTSPAALILKKYEEATVKPILESEKTVLLAFSGNGDAVWMKQAPVIQTTLREQEFAGIDAYQVDMFSQKDLALRFGVVQPGTLLLFKKGVERVRSTGMIKADAIRKMLRLSSVL